MSTRRRRIASALVTVGIITMPACESHPMATREHAPQRPQDSPEQRICRIDAPVCWADLRDC